MFKRRSKRRQSLVLVFTACVLGACSVYVAGELAGEGNEPDCEEREDGANGLCAEGFSCRVGKCIEVNSITEGDTCSESAQCVEGTFCAQNRDGGTPKGRVCKTPCGLPFNASPECGDKALCAPSNAGDNDYGCYALECTTSADCAENNLCIKDGAAQGVCWLGCEVEVSGDDYSDTCPSAPSSNTEYYCSPITRDNETLICLLTSTEAEDFQNQGGQCVLGRKSSACGKGLACLRESSASTTGLCAKYCDAATECASGTTCESVDEPPLNGVSACQ